MANDSKTQRPTLTTAAGIPVGDNQNSLTAGPRGPLLVQDWQLFEKHAHFNRERIPERVVHAKGSAAFGTFTVTNDITRYTKATLFAAVGKKTEVLLRFSTVAGEKGAADAERDVRGFALQVLYRGRQLGPGRQQHAGVLRARSLQVPRFHPHPEARPAHQLRNRHRDVGFLVAVAGEPAPGDDPVLRPRHCRRTTGTCTVSARTPTASSMPRTSACGSSSTSRRLQGIANI